MVNIQTATAEIIREEKQTRRRKKEERKKPQGKNNGHALFHRAAIRRHLTTEQRMSTI